MAEVHSDPILKLAEEAKGAFTPIPGGEKDNILKRGLGKLGHAAEGVFGIAGGAASKGTEITKSKVEALINRMGQVLENKKAFGKSVADFALHGTATRGLSIGSKELAKGIVSWGGLAGAVGGGVTGTVVAGAFVGAVSGALVEYARQVNKNLDRKAEADPSLAGRRTACFLKFKGLPNKEVLTSIEWKEVRNKAVFGLIAGAGAGALVEYIPEISEFIKNIPGVSGIRDMARDIPGAEGMGQAFQTTEQKIGEVAGAVGQTGGNLLGGAGEMARNIPGVSGTGDLAGAAGRTTGDVLGGAKDMAGNIPGVKGVGDFAGGVGEMTDQYVPGVKGAKEIAGRTLGLGDTYESGQVAAQGTDQAAQAVAEGTGQVAEQAAQSADQAAQEATAPSEGLVRQADFDNLKDQFEVQAQQLDEAKKEIAELQRQMEETKQVIAAAKTATPSLDSLGSSISLQAGSNPWEVSTGILKQMGVANPTPAQIMQLDTVLCQENNVGVPAWGIKGTIDARNLPIGFNLNLTDTVKKTALEIASKK